MEYTQRDLDKLRKEKQEEWREGLKKLEEDFFKHTRPMNYIEIEAFSGDTPYHRHKQSLFDTFWRGVDPNFQRVLDPETGWHVYPWELTPSYRGIKHVGRGTVHQEAI